MEKDQTVFYLGSREEPPEQEEQKKEFRIAYGGDLPFELEAFNDKWYSEANKERVALLSQKCLRRSMVVSRMIYLERRQTDILSAMMMHGKNVAVAKRPYMIPALLIFTASIVIPFMIWAATGSVLITLAAFVFLAALAISFGGIDKKVHKRKEEELHWKLKEIELEHDSLELELAELTAKISELRNLDGIEKETTEGQ